MFPDLKNKVVILTGGTGFLGSYIYKTLKKLKVRVIVLDLKKNEKINAKNFYQVDITSETEINKISKIIKIKYKKIDALINNASNNPTPGKNKNIFENFLENSWDEDLNVGLKGSFLCTKIFGRIMKYNSSLTSIINISSDLGIVAPDQSIYENGYKKPVTYSVIKHGIIGLTKYTASYWANQNIRCNTIAPGPIDGNQKSNLKKKLIKKIPSGRLATREDITNTILFLISKKSSYINGATIIIDGGKTII